MHNGGASQIIIGVKGFYFPFSCLLFHRTNIKDLENYFIDDYGFTALKGELVLKGHFYLRVNLHDMTVALNEEKVAVIYAAAVRHICCELENRRRGRKIIYRLPLTENEEIIVSL